MPGGAPLPPAAAAALPSKGRSLASRRYQAVAAPLAAYGVQDVTWSRPFLWSDKQGAQRSYKLYNGAYKLK